MNDKAKIERPIAITIVCIIGSLGLLALVPFFLSDAVKQVATWYLIYLGISSIIGLCCFVGVWKMKKWGVLGYSTIFFINQAIMILVGGWTILGFIIPIVILSVIWFYFRIMQ